MKTSEIISIVALVVPALISITSLGWSICWSIFMHCANKQKWIQQKLSDEQKNQKLSEYNNKIEELKNAQNKILTNGLKEIVESNIKIVDSIISLQKKQDKKAETVFDKAEKTEIM